MDFKVKMCVVSPLPIVVAWMVFAVMEVRAFPVEQIYREPHYDPLENQNVEMAMKSMLVEGDILVDYHKSAFDSFSRLAFDPIWPSGVVPYTLDTLLNETEKQTILAAMSYIMNVTSKCVQFSPRSPNDTVFIFITSSTTGCYSEVGRQGRGNQTVSVSRASDCVTRGIVMHELLHVLGFRHEHTRSDRDQYISIIDRNIRLDRKGDFTIKSDGHNLLIAYDYYSILHYKTNQFSKNNNLKTIELLDATVDERIVGQRFNLSSLDVSRIKRMYNCEELTQTQMRSQQEMLNRDIARTDMAPGTRTSALGIHLVGDKPSAMPGRDLSTIFQEHTRPQTTIRHNNNFPRG